MLKKVIETVVPVDELLANRWSGRAYDPDRQISRDALLALLEAARWSPSCFGEQPWRMVIWNRCNDKENWLRAVACLADSNRQWAEAAPLLGLMCAKQVFERDGKGNRWAQYDAGAACMSLSVQATALGLMVHQMGGFDAEKIKQQFEIPDDVMPMAMLTIGYQLPEDSIPETLRARELAPRTRRPLSELFYEGEWGRGIGSQ